MAFRHSVRNFPLNDTLGVHLPALATQQHVNASVAVAHPRLGDFLDPLAEDGLRAALTPVVVTRSLGLEDGAGPPDAHLPRRSHPVDQLAPPRRPYSFRLMTS